MSAPAARPATLGELFETSFERFRELPAFSSMGTMLAWGEVERLSAAFGAFLRRRLGLAPGERIALMLPNVLQYPVALAGALRARLAVVNVNPLYTAAELRFQLADSGAAAVLVLENFARTLQEALPGTAVRHVVITQLGDLLPQPKRSAVNFAVKHLRRMVPAYSLPQAIALREALAWQGRFDAVPRPEDIAFLQYTGGTTGRPKGAVLTHRNMASNTAQVVAWIGDVLKAGQETVVTALPLYHIFALTANLLVFTALGGCNLLIANPRDLRGLVRTLARTRFTAITGVNTLFAALLDAPGFDRVCRANAAALKLAVGGGTAVERSVSERWQRATGVPIVEGYGLTEASPVVCANPADAREFSGTLGRPLPDTEVTIRDERGAQLPDGEIGEICVRGPQVMRGYWNQPEETARAFFPGGWLRTGDLGRRRRADGAIEFVERAKDVIVVSGFKAWPGEIEAAAKSHPGVADAAAVGVPHPRSGEAVALYVVRRDLSLTEEALAAHCAARLAPYKRPVRIEFRDRLPRSPLGKVLYRELRAQA
jgi:long-chain acyl-CoA synthetase